MRPGMRSSAPIGPTSTGWPPPGVEFPPHCPERSFALSGRRADASAGGAPLAASAPRSTCPARPEDTAISHLHAVLVRAPDGSYSVVDPGSTNGTTLNDDPTALAVNSPVPLADGDRIHLGAWTTITIHARPRPGS